MPEGRGHELIRSAVAGHGEAARSRVAAGLACHVGPPKRRLDKASRSLADRRSFAKASETLRSRPPAGRHAEKHWAHVGLPVAPSAGGLEGRSVVAHSQPQTSCGLSLPRRSLAPPSPPLQCSRRGSNCWHPRLGSSASHQSQPKQPEVPGPRRRAGTTFIVILEGAGAGCASGDKEDQLGALNAWPGAPGRRRVQLFIRIETLTAAWRCRAWGRT